MNTVVGARRKGRSRKVLVFGLLAACLLAGFFELFPHGGTPEAPCAPSRLSDGRILVADDGRLTYRGPNGPERH